MVGIGDHQAARDGGRCCPRHCCMEVEHDDLDIGLGEHRLEPGQAHGIVGSDELLHDPR